MNSKRSFFVILLAASVVVFSGCVEFGEEETETGRGLVITSFDAVPGEVFSGDSFDLLLDVQNVGDRTAENVVANITQKGGASEDNSGFTGDTDLDPPTEDFEGEIHTFDAEMNAPTISVGPEDVRLKGRVNYEYTTDARVLLPIIEKDEYMRRARADEEIPDMGVSRVSKGPFTVSIDGESPARIEEEEGDVDVRFSIEGNNIGSGVPYNTEGHPNPGSDDINEMEVDVDLGDNMEWGEHDDCSDDSVPVRGGDDFQVICRAEYNGAEDFDEVPIDVTLNYGYYIDSETSVRVLEEI